MIDDLGLDWGRFQAVMAIDAPLTLSFLPYGREAQAMLNAAKDEHETLLHLPMQPYGDLNAGPDQVTPGRGEHVRQQTRTNLEKLEGYDGVNNHMGSRVTANRRAMRSVLGVLKEEDLFFLDSRTTTRSVSADVAPTVGATVIEANLFIDGDAGRGGEPAVLRQLTLGAKLAARDGQAILIGHPYPTTIAAVNRWLTSEDASTVRLVTVSALLPTPDPQPVESRPTLRF
ncbi:MAG: divergent polysaccharide deacetylase family protein [Pseudomonadota bacterium]